MRFASLLLLALFACTPAPKPPAGGDTTATDSIAALDSATIIDTGATYDTSAAGRQVLDSAQSARAVRIASLGASVGLLPGPSVTVDTVADTVDTNGYTFRRVAERTATVTVTVFRTDTLASPPAPIITAGRPFGAFGLWESNAIAWGPAPLTLTIITPSPSATCAYIATSRAKKVRVNLFFGGGSHTQYKTNGKFDYAKWRAKIATFNTATNRACVAAGVADGTVIGGALLDEPEIADWGGVLTKPMITQMAVDLKAIFPTLPVGPDHGMQGHRWRTTERYGAAVDFANYQFNWNASRPGGNITAWRTAVLKQAALDGVTPAFSLNVINGGTLDTEGSWNCPQSHQGTRAPLCWMTAAQVSTWGKAQLDGGCALLLWTYGLSGHGFFNVAAYQQAFRDIAAAAAASQDTSCRRR